MSPIVRRRALLGTCFIVASPRWVVLGAGGLLLFGRGRASTPLARIGLALQDDSASASLVPTSRPSAPG